MKASKPRVIGLCVRNSLVTGEFSAQRASNAENVSIWWRHHDVSSWLATTNVDSSYSSCIVIHPILITYIGINTSLHAWCRIYVYSAPSHYLNQCWAIANRALRNKLQWNFNPYTKLFIHNTASEYCIVCEMVATLSRGRWVHIYYFFLREAAVYHTCFTKVFRSGISSYIRLDLHYLFTVTS